MKPSDNELDKLIKEAGDKYHATGADPDWAQMQTLLDKHLPARKSPGKKILFLLILLFLLSGGAYLYFTPIDKKTTIHSTRKSNSIKPAIPIPSQPVNPIEKEIKENVNQNQQPLFSQNKKTIQQQNITASIRSKQQRNYTTANVASNTYQGEIAKDDLPAQNTNANHGANQLENVHPGDDSTIKTTNQKEINGVNNNSIEIPSSPEVTVVENKIPPDTKNTAKYKKNKPTKKSNFPFEFSLVYAPELTTIGFSNIDKPGSNYGFLVGYLISKNLTLQTGIIKSKKNYITNEGDFAAQYPSTSYKLNKAEGYCMMYEIPLNLKSKISRWKKLNVSYTAGISSYFMRSEFYTYHYSTNYGNYSKSVQYNSQKNYWLSLATIGLGFEKEISKSLNIAAMPYVKIPFKGMGEGNLKLLGTGVNFILTYTPAGNKR